MSCANKSRREFLGTTAVATASLAVAPGVMLIDMAHGRAPEEAASSSVRWGMLVDTNKCDSGCTDCVTACNTENGLSGDTSETGSQWIRKVELKDMRTGKATSLPMMCQHCAEPPCVDVCPTGASFKRADGIVLVDKHICIGCRYCVMACPYKARSFIHEALADQNPDVPRGKGVVESCTMCVHRVDKGQTTACAEACTKAGHDAILFGDLNDANSEISKRVSTFATKQVRADLGLNTGVRYQGI
ncbi:sulfate reduction electron transfer complex DsrMKJOP subunit DsrO [Sulfurirhabdus autotrophica]|uniref:Molybdopterin-containing oxidoreductase family iron-sulfur binding subunit n=3 Tax=Sulfurirhabdus autotrophica TaxID=1706046 RepID=A0A4V6P3X0_9PROT|nr:4Fe-4S dicluster domain-containing protein [Sulfurirhabdus autotrophica]TCV86679.1 molybdopterin-containing oxidoreductase family iron-sulfur binding subunit [Sulfurirhabdus autotrophica]